MHRYNKLIRDKIPERELQKGKKISYHAASTDEEYWYLLKNKLQKDIDEFGTAPTLEHVADIFDVLNAMIALKKFDPEEMKLIRENKKIEHGGFTKRWVLDQSEDHIGADNSPNLI